MRLTSLILLSAASGGERTEVVTLTHPKTKKQIQYMFSCGDVFEIQRATPKTPTSWIMDQSICSDGGLYVATRVDPLFLVMPLLESQPVAFSPLSQYLVDEKAPHAKKLQNCKSFELGKICDINGK